MLLTIIAILLHLGDKRPASQPGCLFLYFWELIWIIYLYKHSYLSDENKHFTITTVSEENYHNKCKNIFV